MKDTCAVELESCQDLEAALEICSFLGSLVFSACVLFSAPIDCLLNRIFPISSKLHFAHGPAVDEALAQFYGIVFSLGYIV